MSQIHRLAPPCWFVLGPHGMHIDTAAVEDGPKGAAASRSIGTVMRDAYDAAEIHQWPSRCGDLRSYATVMRRKRPARLRFRLDPLSRMHRRQLASRSAILPSAILFANMAVSGASQVWANPRTFDHCAAALIGFRSQRLPSASLRSTTNILRSTPFVQPKPSWPGYSPPPPASEGSTTSYFSISLPVRR